MKLIRLKRVDNGTVHLESLSRAVAALFIVSILYPGYAGGPFPNNTEVSVLFNIIAVVTGLAFALIGLQIRKEKIDHIDIMFGALCLWMMISTAVMGGDIHNLIKTEISWVLTYVVVSRSIRHDRLWTISVVCLVLLIYCMINLLSSIPVILAGENGHSSIESGNLIDDIWYLGHKNSLRNYFIQLIVYVGIWIEFKSFKYKGLAPALISLALAAYLFVINSITSAVVMLACAIAVPVLIKMDERIKRLAWSFPIAVLAIMPVFILVATYTNIISNVGIILGRDSTFNGRTILWEQALESCANSPLFGTGYLTEPSLNLGSWQASHPHNAELQFAYFYGVPCLLLFILLVGACCLALRKVRDENIVAICSLGMTAFIICGYFGELYSSSFVMFMAVCSSLNFVNGGPQGRGAKSSDGVRI